MQDVLIVGCGYLGRRLAERCLQLGRRVLATTRSIGRADGFRASGIEPIVCDVTEPDTLRALPAVETVVYCIGLDRAAGKSMREVYVEGLRNVLERLPEPGRFLHVSSTSVYGQQAGEAVDESAATNPTEESGQVVLAAEGVVREMLPSAIILRFAGIYGPGRMTRVDALKAGEPLAMNPNRWVNLIHVEDGVSALLTVELRGQLGAIYNVCDDCPVLRLDFYEHFARLAGAPPPRFVASPPGTFMGRDATNRRVLNRRLRKELGAELAYPDYECGLRASLQSPSASEGFRSVPH